jgi:RecB family endonuclease NucS
VAQNPSLALAEPGLTTVETEYSFGTGDRADIVLVDSYGRIVGVEVEPKVGDANEYGPLQAIKYRRMLEWKTNRSPGDSRSVLVAYSISPIMRQKCVRYGIECYEVSLNSVQQWLADKATTVGPSGMKQ